MNKFLVIPLIATLLVAAGCPEPEDDPEEQEWSEAFDASGSWLLSIGGASPDSLYAVGGSPVEGRVVHFDGASWTDVEVDTPLLNWTHSFEDGTTFIAGNDGTILRGDADGFVAMETPTDEDLWGIWGASPDDVWAVGGSGTTDSRSTILRWDGDQWSEVSFDPQRPGVNAYFKVWGTDTDNVWIVGQKGVILYWNGSEFTEQGIGLSRDLISVWGTGPEDVYVVGGRGNGVVGRWDGEAWSSQDLAPAPGLNGVWAGPDGVWIAGVRGLLRQVDVAQSGELFVEREPPLTDLDLHAVFGTSDGTLYTVGGNFGQPQGPYEGVALENK